MLQLPRLLAILTACFAAWVVTPCSADWTKTIDCAANRLYRDIRVDAGREEFCVLALPGFLEVRDGPSRFWYSEGHLGEKGMYKTGRKVGRWRECDRFDHCRDSTYELLYPEERARGVQPLIPLSYSGGRYVFDFNSCWSTWMTRKTSQSFLELNIVRGLVRCQVTYIPSTEADRPAGNQGHYFCEIPDAVGVREFDSLDFRKELPKIGLPQFCREDDKPGTENALNEPTAQGIAIWGNISFTDVITGKKALARETLANVVDVECADVEQPENGPERLTVRLNKYAEDLVLQQMGRDEVKADACSSRFPLSPIVLRQDASGRTLFSMRLSKFRRIPERSCITANLSSKPTCTSSK